MKKFLLATVAFVALGAPALAADLAARPYTKAPPMVAPIYNWTGFYVGGHVGGAFGNDNNFNGLVVGNNNDARFLGGVQVGADYQFAPNWVLGVEGQYSWLGSSNNGAVFPNGYVYTNDQRAIGSITGRIGYTWGPALLYVKGGYAYSDYSESLVTTAGGVPVAFAGGTKHDGYTVGAGLEYLFTQNWSGKVEYQYYDFGKTSFAAPVLAGFGSTRNDEHTVKAGLNYRFNLGGAPLLAKY